MTHSQIHIAAYPDHSPLLAKQMMVQGVAVSFSYDPVRRTPALPVSLAGRGPEAGRAFSHNKAHTEAENNVLPTQRPDGPEAALSRALAGMGARHRAVARENSLAIALQGTADGLGRDQGIGGSGRVIKLPDYADITPHGKIHAVSETAS